MNIPLIDKSSYLRGLLVLARKDNQISQLEKEIIYNAGIRLGFSSAFCREILNTLLQNECLCDEPIKFVNSEVAQSFISDGLILSTAGKLINPAQLIWLKKSATVNGIDLTWFKDQVMKNDKIKNNLSTTQLTLYSII